MMCGEKQFTAIQISIVRLLEQKHARGWFGFTTTCFSKLFSSHHASSKFAHIGSPLGFSTSPACFSLWELPVFPCGKAWNSKSDYQQLENCGGLYHFRGEIPSVYKLHIYKHQGHPIQIRTMAWGVWKGSSSHHPHPLCWCPRPQHFGSWKQCTMGHYRCWIM